MAINQDHLLAGLQAYSLSLDKHLQSLTSEYTQLDQHWIAFSSVYEGNAADQFRYNWLRTKHNFEEYMNATQRISQLLNERIDALIDVTRPGSL